MTVPRIAAVGTERNALTYVRRARRPTRRFLAKVHQQARESLTALMDYIRVTTTRLNVEVDGLDSLRYVMNVLKEVLHFNAGDPGSSNVSK